MMSFWKYHGIGNDFILIDGIGTGKGPDVDVDPERCRLWCDRNFGIGADGVVFLLPGEGADVAMRVINADGSEAEMCGNGIRCLAKHAYDHGYVGGDEDFTVATPAGVKAVSVSFNDGEVTSARVDMGAPVLEGRSIPIDHDGRFIDRPLEVGGIEVKGSAVSMGNPHFVTFADISDDDAARLGPAIGAHPLFPNRTNVEFCRMVEGNMHIRVYERGAGWTLACGTGACAAAVAAALSGLAPFDEQIDVRLPGGWLKVTVEEGPGHVHMEGPAVMIYEGYIL